MACQSCAERRARMKAWIEQRMASAAHWAAIRSGVAEQLDRIEAKVDALHEAEDEEAQAVTLDGQRPSPRQSQDGTLG